MIGVGLFITIIIISAVLLIVNLGTGLVDDATDNLSSISSTLQNQILQDYDNKVLSGTQVRSAIQQYMDSTSVSVVLVNMDGQSVFSGGNKDLTTATLKETVGGGQYCIEEIPGTDGDSVSMSRFSNPENDEYINTSRRYNSYIVRLTDDDGAMLGIVFIPQGATIPESGIVAKS